MGGKSRSCGTLKTRPAWAEYRTAISGDGWGREKKSEKCLLWISSERPPFGQSFQINTIITSIASNDPPEYESDCLRIANSSLIESYRSRSRARWIISFSSSPILRSWCCAFVPTGRLLDSSRISCNSGLFSIFVLFIISVMFKMDPS